MLCVWWAGGYEKASIRLEHFMCAALPCPPPMSWHSSHHRDTASAPVSSLATTGAASTTSNQNNCSRVPVNSPGICAPKQQPKYNSRAALLRSSPPSPSASICGKRPHPPCEAIRYRWEVFYLPPVFFLYICTQFTGPPFPLGAPYHQ